MQTINGHTVLYGKRDAKKWLKENRIHYGTMPSYYPCIATEQQDSYENAMAVYIYKECAQGMLDALNAPKPI